MAVDMPSFIVHYDRVDRHRGSLLAIANDMLAWDMNPDLDQRFPLF